MAEPNGPPPPGEPQTQPPELTVPTDYSASGAIGTDDLTKTDGGCAVSPGTLRVAGARSAEPIAH
jgi:hypothetical protein